MKYCTRTMSQITPKLFIGSAREAMDQRWLKKRGITHIVNMAVEHKNYFPRSFRYFRGNLYDHPNQSLSPAIQDGLRFMAHAISRGGIVFVHCHAGISRASSMVLFYLMKSRGWPLHRALLYTKHFHPRADPNSGFIQQLVKN